MIVKHQFVLQPGKWLGEGEISLNMLEEPLPFSTRWTTLPMQEDGTIASVQEIEIHQVAEKMVNEFVFSEFTDKSFVVSLENQELGQVVGKGIITEEKFAWEFRLSHLGFEGFEFYELGNDQTYQFHAEYGTPDDFRTVIHGKIWVAKEKEPS